MVVPDTPASSPASEARKLPCGRALVAAGPLLPSHVAMTLTQERKAEITAQFGENERTPAAPASRSRCSPQRINDLTEHLREHSKDHASRRGLLMLVGRRRRFLNYMQKSDLDGYRQLVKDLGLRK